jgi:YggT family protein
MQSALIFLFKALADFYLLTFLLRFILQWVRAGYYNPLSQFVLKVTSPLVVPARRVLPSVAGLDVPTLVVLVILESVVTWLLIMLAGFAVPTFFLYVLLRLVALTLWFYTVALLGYVILSWFGGGGSPFATVLGELVLPVLRPVRRVLPPIGGLDLSPLLIMLLCQTAVIALRLPWFLG